MKRLGSDSIAIARKHGFRLGLFALTTATLATVSIVYARQQDGPIGKVTQGLVGGSVIDAARQEEFGLLNLSDSCSASLLRNGWVVTAAHCVDAKDAMGNTMKDPNRPGQNVLSPIANIRVKAAWKEVQERKAVRVETFWPYDVALIQLDAPFKVNGSTRGYSRLVFQDGQFPAFGEPVGVNMLAFGRGIYEFAKNASTPAKRDGLYRVASIKPDENAGTLYGYPGGAANMIAGGDSGGPSFAWTLNGWAVVGVHALTHATYVEGKPKVGWDWVTSTPRAADAPIAPVLPKILAIMGPVPPGEPEPALEPPPPGFIGTFAKTPPDFQPLWVYGLRPNGEMIWYRKDTNAAAWQGPKKVAEGWSGYKDVIAAGGNKFYALTNDNRLIWFEHRGFNDGSPTWTVVNKLRTRIAVKPNPFSMAGKSSEVGRGWTFKKIFSGGEGIIYAIRSDGKLIWYRHTGLNDGSFNWANNGLEVGSGWGGFKDVFCTGQGKVYVVTMDGRLMLYQQKDYAIGAKNWYPARQVGVGWGNFKQIIPCGDGVILAITESGKLLWYHNYYKKPAVRFGRYKEVFEGPVEIGSGWNGFGKVVALIPMATPQVVR